MGYTKLADDDIFCKELEMKKKLSEMRYRDKIKKNLAIRKIRYKNDPEYRERVKEIALKCKLKKLSPVENSK